MSAPESTAPKANLSLVDGIGLTVGIIIGIGIFKTPQLVAANVDSGAAFIGLWLVGGFITLVGALVYAELAAAYPSTGGEYYFLRRALGPQVSLLFAWARMTVIQTGAIAAVAFVLGDYAQQIAPLGRWGSSIYAAGTLIVLTMINLRGSRPSTNFQKVVELLTIGALLAVVAIGLSSSVAAPAAPAAQATGAGAAGLAMVFILLTYGGWNEAAYLSAELRDAKRNMARMLVIGTLVVICLYLLINLTFLKLLGLEGIRRSDAVAAEALSRVVGDTGAIVIALIICGAAITTLNATIFTGARLYHAIGRDLPSLWKLSFWETQGDKPTNAILLQSAIALALIIFGAMTRDGFKAMVEYTAPVFWFFLLLVGISFFVLRHREPEQERPFRVPLYPFTPGLFCLTCGYLLYSSLVYTGLGALVGIAVLILGVPLLLLARGRPLQAAE